LHNWDQEYEIGYKPKRNCDDNNSIQHITGEPMKAGDQTIISNALRELFKVMILSDEIEEKVKVKINLEHICKREQQLSS
jgi:hypothetical protein